MNPEHAQATDEERLAELADQLADGLRRGSPPEIDALIRQHPDLAEDLRGLWATMLVADCVAAGASSTSEPLGPGSDDPTYNAGGRHGIAPPPGTELGDYELDEVLGRGGMGMVYRARQKSLGRTVALKMILRGAMPTEADLARFRTEAESTARLDHPSIVPIYEVGQHEGQPFFTMKYVAGTTLAQRLADGPIPPREAAELLAPICRAIHFAHERGVLHRDLKPSNILIDEAGYAHVSDFGLAKRVETQEDLTISGAVLGTPSYMSPEQAAGKRGKVGRGSDVYCLGTILYQMLTGRPPFQAASPVETLMMVVEQEPLPPRLLNPRADRELEMIALKCLQKPPELRYATAAELADDLEAYLADEPTAARSGQFMQVVARAFRETHHATVLENWGVLWMWHSLALFITCFLTNVLQWLGTQSPVPYLVLWTAGLGTWAMIFWGLRRRSGPVTFVERQIAHVWAASMASIALLFVVEMILGMQVLTLSPVLALTSGMIFLVKAGMLTGQFYLQSVALFATAIVMAALQRWNIPVGITLFGIVSAGCFFFPGLKYYRQQQQAARDAAG
ncbi:MAG: serine/threonine protein kinase [Planctomycetota bacterium]|nr:MAG: serine/threonine protein kinase [Planctomycetota bacterium]